MYNMYMYSRFQLLGSAYFCFQLLSSVGVGCALRLSVAVYIHVHVHFSQNLALCDTGYQYAQQNVCCGKIAVHC